MVQFSRKLKLPEIFANNVRSPSLILCSVIDSGHHVLTTDILLSVFGYEGCKHLLQISNSNFLLSGFPCATAEVVSMTAMIFFHIYKTHS